jgi:tetrahedral aminopeptidase
MAYELKEHLRALVEAHGPSGHEAGVRDVVRAAWEPMTDAFEQDGLGSLIGIKRATVPTDPPRRIMLAAHIDEIAMMVRDVVDGFVYVARVAGMDNRVQPAQPVLVHGRELLPGVVATKPPHLLDADERRKYPTFDDLIVDVGLSHEETTALVRPGDLVTANVPMLELAGNKLAGKAMDDRACVAAVTHALHLLSGMQHQWDVYAAATVQEESGLIGATTAAHHIDPDIAIALDVTFAKQPGVTGNSLADLGGGPGLSYGPNFHIKLFDEITASAKSLEMPLQDDIITGRSGTDAWAIQVARLGVPTALLNIPLRNMHSPVETVDLRDIERTGRLLAHFIAKLDADFLATIDWTRTTADET